MSDTSKRWMLIGAVSLALTSLGAKPAAAKEKESAKEEDEVKMTFKEVPSEVRATLKREAFGEKIATVDKEKKDGRTVYEADVMIDGTNYEILVDKKGKLLSKAIDAEEEGDKGDEGKDKAEGKSEKKVKSSKADAEDDEKGEDAEKKDKHSKAESREKGDKKEMKARNDKEDDDEKPAKKSVKKKSGDKEDEKD